MIRNYNDFYDCPELDLGYVRDLMRYSPDDDNCQLNIDNRNINKKLEFCQKTQDKTFRLSGKFIKYIPNELREFTWVEDLCIEKTSIITLENLPPNLKTLTCEGNNIPILDGSVLPDSLTKFIFVDNDCIDINGLKEGITELSLEGNNLYNLDNKIPNSTVILDLSRNELLKNLPLFNDNLKGLLINRTSIKNIDKLNDNIQILETCNCNIQTIKKLPKELIVWKSYISCIESIECDFPVNLQELDLFNNSLVKIPKLPDTLKIIDLSNNELKSIPDFPLTIQSIELKKNRELNIREIEQLKKKLPNEVKLLYDSEEENMAQNIRDLFANNNNIMSMRQTKSSRYSADNPHYIVITKSYKI